MKKKLFIFLTFFFVPQIVFAAWWNPFSWGIFARFFPQKTQVQEILPESSTPANTVAEEVKKEEIEPVSTKRDLEIEKKEVVQSRQPTIEPKSTQEILPKSESSVSYSDLLDEYSKFKTRVIDERSDVMNGTGSISEKDYLTFLTNFLQRVNSDNGYLILYKDKVRPAGIEQTYLKKLADLKKEFTDNQTLFSSRLQNEIRNSQIEKGLQVEMAEQEKKQYVKELKIKIAELDQLRTQIETLPRESLVPILNSVKKIDGEPIFYSFEYQVGYETRKLNFPYAVELFGVPVQKVVQDGLKGIVSNYRAYLVVELARYED